MKSSERVVIILINTYCKGQLRAPQPYTDSWVNKIFEKKMAQMPKKLKKNRMFQGFKCVSLKMPFLFSLVFVATDCLRCRKQLMDVGKHLLFPRDLALEVKRYDVLDCFLFSYS